MVKRGTIISLALLCALACLAVGASGASAVGTTAFTCIPFTTGNGTAFKDPHCKEPLAEGGKFEEFAFGPEVTEVVAKSLNTEGKTLSFTGGFSRNGSTVEFTCSGVQLEGNLSNTVIGGTMQTVGEGVSFDMVGCVVVKPAGCKIKNGEIEFPNLVSSSFEGGVFGMGVEFEPPAGKKLGDIVLEGCKTMALNGAIPFEGSFVALFEGATLVTTAATTEASLTLGGKPAVLGTVLTTRKDGLIEQPAMVMSTTEP